MKNEIEKLGIHVDFFGETNFVTALEILPKKTSFPGDLSFESYGDHRTAMSLAPLALKTGRVKLLNPDVVVKSYPGFWDDLRRVGFEIS
jgi:3-phosphoshikimate 1-carboxyvinyltransferase